MKTNLSGIPNEIPDFVEEHDVFGLINPKRIKDTKTLNAILHESAPRLHVKYAGNADKTFAFIIDIIILTVFFALIKELIINSFSLYLSSRVPEIIIAAILWVVYNGAFESSKLQATIGKMFFRLKVIDNQGERIHFIRASMRSILAFCNIIPLGFGLWGINKDKRKQGFHDILLDCYVVKC